MSDDNETWSTAQMASSSYHMSTNHMPFLHEQMGQSYSPWHKQVVSTSQASYLPKVSLENQIPPNVNPFTRSSYVADSNSWNGYSNNLDAEVSYYNNFSGLAPSSQWYDENRCSSTDTSLSSSSTSTVFSHGSVDTEFINAYEQSGQKRKSQNQQTNLSKKAKRDTSGLTYRRWPKPPYSYTGMIAVAIQISPKKELTLQGIHAALMELFPFFRGTYTGWRCSVRHNLSHSSCFVKLPSVHSQRAGLWTVDWTNVSPAIFKRQQSKLAEPDQYKDTIHEHLGLEPYHDTACAQNDTSVRNNKKKTSAQPKIKRGKNRTPQMSDTHNFSVKLPGVDKCQNKNNSPSLFRPRDVSVTRADDPLYCQMTPAATSSFCESYYPFYDSFLDVIMATRRSSLDAAQHLQSLSAPVTQLPLIPAITELPPLSRDSDVYTPMTPESYTPMTPEKNVYRNLSANMSGEVINASDAHFEQGYTTVSPCKTLMTSFLDSDKNVTAEECQKSESSATKAEVTTDVTKETFTNI